MPKRLTIVKDDNLVRIDHRSLRFDLSPYRLPDNFHALQWYEDRGEMEFNDGTHNERITDITIFQPIIDEFTRLAETGDNPPAPTEEEKYANLVSQRDSYLGQTDWFIIRHSEQKRIKQAISLEDDVVSELLVWRQELRDLPETYNNSEDWEWPDPPDFLVPECLAGYPPERT